MSNDNIYIQAYYKGGMTGFEVIPGEDQYTVARNGEIIAVLKQSPNWNQVSGDKLPDDVLESIIQEIEKPLGHA
jgi:hypothetical protein